MIEVLILIFQIIAFLFFMACFCASFLSCIQGVFIIAFCNSPEFNILSKEKNKNINQEIKKDMKLSSIILIGSFLCVVFIACCIGSDVEKRQIKLQNKQQEFVLIK